MSGLNIPNPIIDKYMKDQDGSFTKIDLYVPIKKVDEMIKGISEVYEKLNDIIDCYDKHGREPEVHQIKDLTYIIDLMHDKLLNIK